MPQHKHNKKHKKRYLIYKGKKYKIISKASDHEIYKILGKIISKLITKKGNQSRLSHKNMSRSSYNNAISQLALIISASQSHANPHIGNLEFKQSQLENKIKNLKGSKEKPINVDELMKQIGTKMNPINVPAAPQTHMIEDDIKFLNGFDNYK